MRKTSASSESLQENTCENYVAKLFAAEDEALKQIRARIVATGRDGMQVSATEGRILQVLMKMNNVHKAVEFGTFLGYSGTWIARGLAPGGHLWTAEVDADYAAQARAGFAEAGVGERVTVLLGEAPQVLESIEKEAPFDMVFIDANKSEYVHALEWAQRHLRKGGLLIGDNVYLFGTVWQTPRPPSESEARWSAMRTFNERLADRTQWESVILPTSEGMAIAIKR